MSINHSEFEHLISNESEKNSDNFWQRNNEEIKKQLGNILNYSQKRSNEDYQEILDDKFKKEKQFSIDVIQATEKALQNTDKELIVLFDIDDTIGKFLHFDEAEYYLRKKVDNNGMTLLRPSFPLLMEQYFKKYIDNKKIKIGFISTRSDSAMRKQLGNENQLGQIDKYIDKELLYSTYNPSASNIISNITTDEEKINFLNNNCGEILSRHFPDNDLPEDYYDLTSIGGNLQKLEIIRSLKEGNLKENHILCIDDFGYTKYLNEKDCFGVCVYDNLFGLR